MSEIEIRNVSKTYVQDNVSFEALKDVNLNIEKGDIYGVIGMSGAGKSTLIRCLNFLEKPTEGQILIKGKDLGTLKEKELRLERRKISMIFQHFNLLSQKNVIDNIIFPLTLQGVKKKEATKKALNLLALVGMEDKAKSYPSQLSGGQQQRVAIARALATDPDILLCDEATSALDPQTTQAILDLLKTIHDELQITIVIITHQMAVVRSICNKVAILDNGVQVENGDIETIFSHPKSRAAKKLIFSDQESFTNKTLSTQIKNTRTIRIVFHENSSFEPVIANLILKFNAPVNILKADTKNVNGFAQGEMIISLPEDKHLWVDMEQYLIEKGLEVQEVTDYVG